MNYIGGKFM